MGVGGQRHAPAALPPGKIRYSLYRWLGGPQGRSGRVRKRYPPPAFDPRTLQPVASRYTDYGVNWIEGGRAPDSVRVRRRRAESLPKSRTEVPPAIPQSGNYCADRQLARQDGILRSVTGNWEDAMLGSVVRLSCGETEYSSRFNLPTTRYPAVLSYFTGEICQVIYNNANAPQFGDSCPSSPFTAAIIRSRINTAGTGRRNSPSTALSSSIRFEFRLPRPKEGTTADVNLSSTSLPYFRQLASRPICTFMGPKFCVTRIFVPPFSGSFETRS